MKERKYKEDWSLQEDWDAKNRPRRTPVYRGPVYRTPESRRTLLVRSAVPWVFWLILLVLYFRLNFPGATVLYVFLPAALALFPGLYWLLGIWGILRAPREMTRLQKENSIGRVLRSAAGCAILNLAALIGDLILVLTGPLFPQEWPGMALLACSLMIAIFTAGFFRDADRRLQEERKENP